VDNIPAIIAVTLTGVAMLGGAMLYVIRGEIGKATKDLQPKNGGTGWSDVHHKLDTVLHRQGEVIEDVQYLRERIDRHVDSHDHTNPTNNFRRSTDNDRS
jgi:hypothetical protein